MLHLIFLLGKRSVNACIDWKVRSQTAEAPPAGAPREGSQEGSPRPQELGC